MASGKDIKAGRAFVEISANSKLQKGLLAASNELKKFGKGIEHAGLKILGIGVALKGGLVAAATYFADAGHAVEVMSSKTGLGIEVLSELKFAAEQSGVEMEMLDKGFRKMQKSIIGFVRGGGAAAVAFAQLHLRVSDLMGLSPDQQFEKIAEALSKVKDPALRATLAMEIFGKSGTELLPLLEKGSAGIDELRAKARELGLVMSEDDVKGATALHSAMKALSAVVKMGTFLIGSALAPAMQTFYEYAINVGAAVNGWIGKNKRLFESISKLATLVVGAGVAIVGIGFTIKYVLSSALKAAAGAIGLFLGSIKIVLGTLAFLITPMGIVVGLALAIGAATLYFTGAGKRAIDVFAAAFTDLKDSVGAAWAEILADLQAGDIEAAWKVTAAAMKVIWAEAIAAIKMLWMDFKGWIAGAALDVWASVQAAAEIAVHGVKSAWIEASSFLQKLWRNTADAYGTIWEEMYALGAKAMVYAMGEGDTEYGKSLLANTEENKNARIAAIGKANLDANSKNDSDLAESQRREESEHLQAMAKISNDNERAKAAIKGADQAQIETLKKELEAAKKDLAAAIVGSGQRREENAGREAFYRRKAGYGSGMQSADDMDQIIRGTGAYGTFNPAAGLRTAVGGAQSPAVKAAVKTAGHAEKAEGHLLKIKDSTRQLNDKIDTAFAFA